MECRYCQTWNEEDDHRCGRCGRRLRASAARPAPDSYPIMTATAPSLMRLYESVVSTDQATAPEPEAVVQQRVTYQRSLFEEMRRVVQMPRLASAEPARPSRSRSGVTRRRRPIEGQQHLDFDAALDFAEVGTETVIYCDAPVALPTHRIMASALDVSMILIGFGLFLLTFDLAGGDIVLNKQTIPLFGILGAFVALFYHLLFCLSGGDTAGMHWTQLRLMNFDGQEPDAKQRTTRLVGGCLSLLAAGLGMIWALVDEESLTWHDHISRTFPSPHTPNSR
jgi:uncharacterized RDD family membrane protein YckC